MKIRGLRDIRALEERPLDSYLRHRTVYESLLAASREFADRPALTYLPQGRAGDEPHEWTFGELAGEIHRTARLLRALDVRSTDAVATLLPNLPECYFLMWAAAACGIAAPLNPAIEVNRIVALLKTGRAKVLVGPDPDAWPQLWEKAEAAAGAAGIELLATAHAPSSGLRSLGDRHDYDPSPLADEVAFDPSRVVSYFHTGGTTALPKLAQHTQRNQLYAAWVHRDIFDIGSTDVMLSGLPLFHVNAAILGGLTCVTAGARIVLLGPRGFQSRETVADFWEIVERFGGTVFTAVPTVYAALAEVPVGDTRIGSLRYGVCGAAPITKRAFERFEEATGVTILEGYGLTESTLGSTLTPVYGERRLGSVGLPHPFHRIRVVKLDEDGAYERDCEVEEVGMLCMTGPNIFPGYVVDEQNEDIWLEGGWFKTGDLGYVDGDGYVWLAGRRKDLIIRGGHNVDPAAIEEAVAEHPAVMAAAAVAAPDARLGEVPVVYVELRPGASASEAELLAFAEARAPERQSVPIWVAIVGALPKTIVGKISKVELRRMAAERTIRAQARAGGLRDARFEVISSANGTTEVVVAAGDGAHGAELERLLSALGLKIRHMEESR